MKVHNNLLCLCLNWFWDFSFLSSRTAINIPEQNKCGFIRYVYSCPWGDFESNFGSGPLDLGVCDQILDGLTLKEILLDVNMVFHLRLFSLQNKVE